MKHEHGLILLFQIDICSFNRAIDWPTFDVSSAQLIERLRITTTHRCLIIYHWDELSHKGAELSKRAVWPELSPSRSICNFFLNSFIHANVLLSLN